MLPDFANILSNPYFAKFFALWQSNRIGEDLPSRQNIKLRELAGFVENMLVYNWDGDTRLTSRIMGEQVAERVKLAPQDVNWMDHIAADMIIASKHWWNDLYNQPCAGAMEYSMSYMDGNCKIGQALFLPVQHANGQLHVYALNQASNVYRVDQPRSSFMIGSDLLKTCFFNIGFGLPGSGGDIISHKISDSAGPA